MLSSNRVLKILARRAIAQLSSSLQFVHHDRSARKDLKCSKSGLDGIYKIVQKNYYDV